MSMLTVEECELLTDSKYRSYISQVEKALRNFEYTSEWADLISALGKLNKVLLSHLKYPVIPKKVTIGKRLAQCLHPALPSGVHLKALESYDIIFKCIGTQRLAHDLFIYSAGMFPLLSHAAMSVKPVLLTVYEKHFVALGRHIKPGLNGLLLGLLPGLEEGAEFFDRTNLLLEDFCDASGPPFFYTGIWQCVLSCPSVRLSGTTFLLNHLNKRQSMEDQLHMVGLDIDLMVGGICSCLQDSSVLVQRSMLDFLLQAFPMHNGQLTRGDVAKIVEAAVNVVLRRDMSLNRRLYAWLLGTSTTGTTATTTHAENHTRTRADSSSTTSEMDLSYFQTYSKDLLVAALKSKLSVEEDNTHSSDGHPAVLKPFRILISLLDKPEIGPVVIESVLLSVFRRLKQESTQYVTTAQMDQSRTSGLNTPETKLPLETLKTANLLFSSFEPYYIWDFIGRTFSSSCEYTTGKTSEVTSDVISIVELCEMVEFLLDVIALDIYPETTTEHLPDLLRQVITALTASCERISEIEVTTTLKLCSKLLYRVQPSMAGFGLDRSMSTDTGDNISTYSNSELSRSADSGRPRGITTDVDKQRTRSGEKKKEQNVQPIEENEEERKAENLQERGENCGLNRDANDTSGQEKRELIEGSHCEEEIRIDEKSNALEDTSEESDSSTAEESKDESERGDSESVALTCSCDSKPCDVAHENNGTQNDVEHEEDLTVSIPRGSEIHEDCNSSETGGDSGFSRNGKDLGMVTPNSTGESLDLTSGSSEIMDSGMGPSDMGSPASTSGSSDMDKEIDKKEDISDKQRPQDMPMESVTQKSNMSDNLLSGHLNLMQLCVQSFQQFFHRFSHLRILRSNAFYTDCMKHLTLSSSKSFSPSSFRDDVLGKEEEVDQKCNLCPKTGKLLIGEELQEVKKAYTRACRLLVDFASFPIYCADYQNIIEQMCSPDGDSEEGNQQGLPLWLQDLLVCSCYVDCFEIQSSSISTLLEMIILTQSLQMESQSKTRTLGRRSLSEGRISVVILPALLPTHLQYINEKTVFYQRIATELWNFLEDRCEDKHQRAVELFHTLHQVTPTANVCEDVIGQDLIQEAEVERIAAFKKFSTLWHLTRSLKSEPHPSRSPRTFDRSMFVVLDSLKEDSSITKSLALTWLTHVIQRGDTSRVLQPLLLMLLHPDTARISIQHVSVHKPKKVTVSEEGEDDIEAKIYAISSDGGNVIYHLSQGTNQQLSKKLSHKSSQDLKSYALTVMNHKGATDTAPVRTHSVTDLSFERVNPENVKLRMNPFGSESSLDKLIFDGFDFPQSSSMPNLESVKRLNSDVCRKEGIFFDGAEVADEGLVNPAEDQVRAEPVDSSATKSDDTSKTGANNSMDILPDNLEDPNMGLASVDVAKWIMESIISSVFDQVNSESTSDGEGSVKKKKKLPLSSDTDATLESTSIEDLRKIEVDSTSGSENGDISSRHPSSSSTLRERLGSSTANLRDTEGSMDSLTTPGQESDSPRVFDHRELNPTTDIHELHLHILLYCQQFDYRRTIYAFSTIRAMLLTCPRLVVTAMVTTSISSVRPPHLAKLQSLLGRHRKSVFGKNFFGDLPPEVMSSYRSNMFVEIVISLCLYFVRGYYPNLMMSKLTKEELLGNKMVHIMGIEILTLLVSELLAIMKESGKSFVSYISDLLSRCKLQKSLLHCLLASVYNQGRSGIPPTSASSKGGKGKKEEAAKLTETIIDFNENSLDPSVNDTFQVKLLQLMLVLIMLEDHIHQGSESQTSTSTPSSSSGSGGSGSNAESQRTHLSASLLNVHYNTNLPVIQQEMFLSAVWCALKQHHQCHLHRHWIGLVTSALPYMGKAMARTVLCVVLQLCRNLETMSACLDKKKWTMQRVPPDHVVSMLEGLTTLCHYCLLDNTSPMSIGQPAPTATQISTETASAGQILTNLIHVFNPVLSGKEPSPARDSNPVSPVLEARGRLLSILPRVMACMATLWKAVTVKAEDGMEYIASHPCVGDFKAVRQHILELLSPISLPHGTHLMAAFAVAWNDRRQKFAGASSKKHQGMQPPCEDQLLLVELISAIKVLPTDTFIQTVKQVLKQPPHSELTKKGLPLELNLLQFFLAYMHNMTSSGQLVDSWPSLLSLAKDGLQMNLSPPVLFLLLQILSEFVHKTPTMEEKKHQKDLQEICQKALESVSAVAGSSLEQTTWLRRNFAVKPGPQEEGEGEEEGQEEEAASEAKKDTGSLKTLVRRSQASDSKYSVQALGLLAELTASMLDVIYSSEEKDKVAPFLVTLLYNVFPYLRHHSSHNLPSYRACSQLLASLSGYQYARRAWRKEAFELLMESSFFQMDAKSIACWRLIIDNLMTHDKITFKDLMSRVSITQTGSLSLFSSKEQEYEQRAAMMKRLAFTVFCSEMDQYQRAMPEIQERLAECLRLPQVASIMSQVFLCFRVLILRMSPQHLTSLWPTIITEMVQVLLQVEQELSTETDEFKTQIQRIAALDSSWAHLGNGLNAHNNPSWLQLYLSVCKLLDMCLVMPADAVPQFQLYRWAFVGTAGEEEFRGIDTLVDDSSWRPNPLFTPHIIRLSRLINNKMKKVPALIKAERGHPLLSIHCLRSLSELQPFFYTLCHMAESQHCLSMGPGRQTNGPPVTSTGRRGPRTTQDKDHTGVGKDAVNTMTSREYMEHLLEMDFLESLT